MMKDSGIEWIGEIPESWGVTKLKNLLLLNDGGVWGDEPQDNAADKVVLRSTEQTIDGEWSIINPAKRDLSGINYSKCRILPNDLLMTKSSGSSLHIGKTTLAGDYFNNNECYYSNFMQRLRVRGERCAPKYLWYILNSPFVREQFVFMQNSTSGLSNINAENISNIQLPKAPLAEQKKIADFLDGKCAEIDELVQTEEKMIEELKAYKQSVITEAVTKGLDPSAPMKDSGIEWIGKIPECWEIMTLKSLFDFGKGLPITKEDLRVSGEKVISYGQIHAKFNISTRIVNDMYRFVDSVYVDSHSNSIVKVGDFIFADTSEDLSGVGDFVYINDNDVIFAGYHSIILKSRMTASNKYLAYLFLSDCWRSQLRSRVSGIKVFSISKNILSRVTVLFPSASEQQKIADYLDDKCAKIDEMIAIRNEQIDQLKDYKKSLIYEYVTGKKEVV